ncbi:MAG: zinc ribbon domain-containing protein [Prevotella sp.]|nr:zinc ribbon domain-containing protein [Prevotella sp.]
MTYCSNCGTALRDGEKFCHECGARVEQPAVSQGDASTQPLVTPQQPVGMSYGVPPIPPQQPVGAPPIPPQPPMGTPYGAAPQQMAQPMPQQKKDGKRIALKVFLAFLPLIIGVGGYSLWYNLGKKATENALKPSQKQQAEQPITEGDLVIEEKTKDASSTTEKQEKASSNDPKPMQIDICTPSSGTTSGKSTVRENIPVRSTARQGEPMGMTDEEYEATYGQRQNVPSISSQQRQQRQATQQQTRRRRSAEEIVGSFGPNTDESARARVRQLKAQGRITAEEYNDCMRYIDRRRHAGQ